ncbi:MAG: Uma2 family endonuclease [Deltaproteobacteria bacterium]|nr:Uma2 family endonuclease [Deltaproteobacteria bacterium]
METSSSMWPPEGRVVLRGVSWARYEALLAALGDDYPSLRLTYLKGTLEIMTTSRLHERIKKLLARLLEMWAVERGRTLEGEGSATFRKREAERGLEPDECYMLGPDRDFPDLAIEVVHTHGGIDKLDVYAGLGVREVWFWEDGAIAVYALVGERYERHSTSALLPDLDLAQLASFVSRGLGERDQTALVRAYRDALRSE